MIDLAAETRAKRTKHRGQNRVGLGGRDRISGRYIGREVCERHRPQRERQREGQREEKNVEHNLWETRTPFENLHRALRRKKNQVMSAAVGEEKQKDKKKKKDTHQ